MTNSGSLTDEQNMLAAEYAFGLLEGEALSAAEALRKQDPAFAAAVRRWEAEGVSMMESLTPVAPPPEFWQKLETAASQIDTSRVIDMAANDADLIRRLSFWRGGAFVGMALAASLALVMLVPDDTRTLPDLPSASGDSHLATVHIVDSDDQPIATAIFDQASGTMRVKLDVESKADVVPEFWIIPADGTPRSLGRTAVGNVQLTKQQQQLIFEGGSFAVSLEPDDGVVSPTPRGQVLGAAPIRLL